MQSNEFGPLFHTIYKNTKKWIIDLNVKVKTTKLLQQNINVNLHDLGLKQWFLGYEIKSISNKRKYKLDFSEINFCASKGTMKQIKMTYRIGKNCRTHIDPLQLNNEDKPDFKKEKKALNRQVSKEDIQIVNKHIKTVQHH